MKLKNSILAIIIGLAGATVIAPPASAASDYDDKITSTNELLWNIDGQNKDITLDWSTYLLDYLENQCTNYGGVNCTVKNQFENNLNAGGGWAVQQLNDLNAVGNKSWRVLIFNHDATITFDNTYYEAGKDWYYLKPSSGDLAILEFYGGSSITSQNYASNVHFDIYTSDSWQNAIWGYYWSTQYNSQPYLFISSDYKQYPSNYEGEYIPDSVDTPVTGEPPHIKYEVDQLRVSATYMENIDMDLSVEGTEDDENYKVLWSIMENIDGNATTIHTATTQPDEQFKYQVPRTGSYTITATVLWRGAPFNPPVIEDEEQVPVMVNIPINGGQYSGDTGTDECEVKNGYTHCEAPSYECVSTEFPFIDLPTCIGNLGAMVQIAIIGQTTFALSEDWVATDGCYTLEVIDDWMNVEGDNRTLCPQVPEYVRNITTPFVTLLLGFVTARFLIEKTGKDF